MVESDDYWRGHGDALTELETRLSLRSNADFTLADIGQVILDLRAESERSHRMNEPC